MTTMMMIHHSAGSLKQQANGNPSATRQMDEHQFGRIEHQFAISSSSNFTAAAEQQASSTSRPASSASNSATQDDQYQLLAIKQHHQQPTTNDHFFAAKSGPEGGATLQVPEQHQDLQDAALHYYGAKSLHLGSNYHYQTQANLNRAFQQQQQQPVLSSSNCTGATAATSQQFVHDYYQAEYSTVQPANAICHNTTLPANALNAASLTGSYYSSGFPCESSTHQAQYGSPADYYQNYQHYQSLAAQQSQQVESTSYLGSLYEQQYSGQSVAAPSQPADGFVAGHPLTPTQHLERRSTPIQASSHARRLQRFAQLASSYQSCAASYPASVAPPPQHQSRLVRSVNKLKPADRLQRVQSSSTCDELGTVSGPPKIMSRRKNATRETTATLKAWLDENGHNPYPTKGEKMLLSMVTRMSQVQISTWFANARRRMKKENRAGWPSQRLQVSGSNSAGSGQAQVGTADGLAAMRSFLCRYQERLAAEGKSPALLAQISGGLQLHGFSLVTDNKSCTRLHSLVSLGGPRSSSCGKAPSPPSSSSSSEGSCSSAASDQSTGSPRGEPSSTTGNCDRIV